MQQVPGIGKLLSERLHAAGMSSLRQLAAVDPRRIEATTQRHYPFGAAHPWSSYMAQCWQHAVCDC